MRGSTEASDEMAPIFRPFPCNPHGVINKEVSVEYHNERYTWNDALSQRTLSGLIGTPRACNVSNIDRCMSFQKAGNAEMIGPRQSLYVNACALWRMEDIGSCRLCHGRQGQVSQSTSRHHLVKVE